MFTDGSSRAISTLSLIFLSTVSGTLAVTLTLSNFTGFLACSSAVHNACPMASHSHRVRLGTRALSLFPLISFPSHQYTVLLRNQGHVLKSENTLIWLLVVFTHMCFLWNALCTHLPITAQSLSLQSQIVYNCDLIPLLPIRRSFFGSFLRTCAKMWRCSYLILRGLRPCVSLFYIPEIHFCKPSWKNVKPHHRDLNQGPSAYLADALTTALWCSSHPQQRKHGISPTCLHLLATHTTQVGLRPQTIVGSATCLVELPSWRTLDERTWLAETEARHVVSNPLKFQKKTSRVSFFLLVLLFLNF